MCTFDNEDHEATSAPNMQDRRKTEALTDNGSSPNLWFFGPRGDEMFIYSSFFSYARRKFYVNMLTLRS